MIRPYISSLKHLAFLLASERSIFTATKTSWSSGTSKRNSLSMNFCIPSASHRWTWETDERRENKPTVLPCEGTCCSGVEPTDLSELAFSQLFFKRQHLAWKFLHGNVLPWQQVHGYRGDGVGVAPSHTLQVDNVSLCVVRDSILGYGGGGGFGGSSAGRSWKNTWTGVSE